MEAKLINLNINRGVRKLFEEREIAVSQMAKEIAEREFEILEFNLFVSSAGKKRLAKISKDVRELRDKVDKGGVNISQFDEFSEEF